MAGVAVSVWASGWHRFTTEARVGTFACAGIVLAAGVLRPPQRPGDRQVAKVIGVSGASGASGRWRRGTLAWLALAAIAGAWDILGLLAPPGRPHVTLSATELAERPFHAVLFALWLAIGWTLASTPLRNQRRHEDDRRHPEAGA